MVVEPHNLPFKADNQTFFMVLCYSGDFSLLKIALASRNLDVNKKDGTGRNALHYSLLGMKVENIDFIVALVEAGVSVNYTDKERNASPLFTAVEKSFNKIAEFLIANGASIEICLKTNGLALI